MVNIFPCVKICADKYVSRKVQSQGISQYSLNVERSNQINSSGLKLFSMIDSYMLIKILWKESWMITLRKIHQNRIPFEVFRSPSLRSSPPGLGGWVIKNFPHLLSQNLHDQGSNHKRYVSVIGRILKSASFAQMVFSFSLWQSRQS